MINEAPAEKVVPERENNPRGTTEAEEKGMINEAPAEKVVPEKENAP